MPGRRPSPTFATSNLQIKARWRYVRDFNSVACLQTSYKSWKQLKRRHAWFFGWFSSCLWIRTCGWLGGELQWPVQEIDVYTLHTLIAGETFDGLFIDLLGCWSQKFKILWPLSKVKQDYSKDIHCGSKQQKEPIVISIFGTLTSRTMQPEKKIMISNINHDISYYIYNSLRSAERNTIPVEYTQ